MAVDKRTPSMPNSHDIVMRLSIAPTLLQQEPVVSTKITTKLHSRVTSEPDHLTWMGRVGPIHHTQNLSTQTHRYTTFRTPAYRNPEPERSPFQRRAVRTVPKYDHRDTTGTHSPLVVDSNTTIPFLRKHLGIA